MKKVDIYHKNLKDYIKGLNKMRQALGYNKMGLYEVLPIIADAIAEVDTGVYNMFNNWIKKYPKIGKDLGLRRPKWIGLLVVLPNIADAIGAEDINVYNMFLDWVTNYPEIGKDLGFEYPEGM